MTVIRLETLTLPAARLGRENPFPVIEKAADAHASIATDATFPESEREGLGWGMPPTMLPYRLQDGYDRSREPRAFQSVVLENEHLRAVFLPELGGHLWSLVSKDSGAELLARNPVFQPCNLAIRNAWISGGIEWNLGWPGHWPLTCSPLFAAVRHLPDGTPELRLWEYERVRKLTLQIDAWLPSGSRVLFVRIAIRNPNAELVPAYWWTNIAVPQTPDTRVLVPADETLLHLYETHALGCAAMSVWKDDDMTRPGRMRGARDFFFRVPDGEAHPWIAAVQPGGRGFFQTSTSRLRGRKLFRWGIQPGGAFWQRFLGTPDYIELQAGLARTQSHQIPFPAGALWDWVEAFGEATFGPSALAEDWTAARGEGERAVRAVVGGAELDAALAASREWASVPVRADEIVATGSGWGALEALRRSGDTAFPGLPGIVFPADSIGAEQIPWHGLLDGGVIAERPVGEPPGAFAGREWRAALAASLDRPGGRNWLSLFHLGVIDWGAGKAEEAVAEWTASCAARENPWARRSLGLAKRLAGDMAGGRADLLAAYAQAPELRPLRLEALGALVADGLAAEALTLVESLSGEARADSRVRLAQVRSLALLGRLDEAEEILMSTPYAADMREGETSVPSLWIEIQARRDGLVAPGAAVTKEQRADFARRYVPPASIDNRMNA